MWLAEMEKRGLRAVYLRNYEALPQDIGNDVDLLIERGRTKAWIAAAKEFASKFGWRFLRSIPFGCTSLFFFRPDSDEVLHVDLNDRIEWHCVPFADATVILSRRRWNGTVFIPAPEDELFLNVATRLVYQGKVREKHRVQWNRLRAIGSRDQLASAFSRLGSKALANRIVDLADSGDWDSIESLHGRIRRHLLIMAAIHPLQTAAGMIRFAGRTMRRLVRPPGFRFLFVASGTEEPCIADALSKCADALARWGNLSECRLESPQGLSARLRQYLFRARNGVVAGLVSMSSMRNNRGNTLRIPITGIVDGAKTQDELARRLVEAVRDSFSAKTRTGGGLA